MHRSSKNRGKLDEQTQNLTRRMKKRKGRRWRRGRRRRKRRRGGRRRRMLTEFLCSHFSYIIHHADVWTWAYFMPLNNRMAA